MQGYCTQEALRKAYPDARVELIDYAAWRPVMKPYIGGMSVRSLRNDLRRIREYRRFFRENLIFSDERLVSRARSEALAFIETQRYDGIYVGSDTVLEQRGAEEDGITAFWLSPTLGGMKCLIAASAHSLTYEALSPGQRAEITASLDDFALLGVRDEGTRRLVARLVGEDDERLQLVPDPTFTYTIDYGPVERYLQRKDIELDRPIVCLHLLRDTEWGGDLAARFRAAGYAVASLRPARYADILFTDMAPFEQMGLYRYFDLVVTHRFHDSVFSFMNGTPVLAFAEHGTDVTKHGESRLHSLYRSFGFEIPGCLAGAQLSADSVFAAHADAMAEFREKRTTVDAALRQNKLRYEAFVARSVARLGAGGTLKAS